ncbi:hypothetical protein [Kitasatospora sp. GAS204B]|uniref:hypothetical protein n=1 Tax=unclassified Kitasatospora TaxID=2633591 RepID=UPI00247350BD|nr:hypothetical protein [Kitasatospora sp. GAS204B]MDH6116815.1 hypothetical protein [Kitasatospora sp. GAS204B]
MASTTNWDNGSAGVTVVTDAWFTEYMVPNLNNMYDDMSGSTGNNGTHVIDMLHDFAGTGGTTPQGG